MEKSLVDYLKSMDKLEYTYYLVGYLAGQVDRPIKEGDLVLDQNALMKIPDLINKTLEYLTSFHGLIVEGLEHYPIVAKMDEFETEVSLVIINEGVEEMSPFTFKLSSLEKRNLN